MQESFQTKRDMNKKRFETKVQYLQAALKQNQTYPWESNSKLFDSKSKPGCRAFQTSTRLFLFQIDYIVHAAAYVNLLYPYEALKGTNVTGTRNILLFARSGKIKPLHYVSTNSVFPDGQVKALLVEKHLIKLTKITISKTKN